MQTGPRQTSGLRQTQTMFIVALYVALSGLSVVSGHGFLQEPPARNAMWRYGYQTEINYNDMGLNCGGYSVQWNIHGGKCGLCGDPFSSSRPHEAGGKYAKVDRPISRCYDKNAKTMDITVRVTAYHRGYFEFRLCVNNDMTSDPGQECAVNGTLLTITGSGKKTRYDINTIAQLIYQFQLDIPDNIECSQCILHWKYNTGNSWGCGDDGKCGMGLGSQEQFINCADIAILPDCSQTSTVKPGTVVTPSVTPYTGNTNPPPSPGSTDVTCRATSAITDPGATCVAVGSFAAVPGMAKWCKESCYDSILPLCPAEQCSCSSK